MITLFLYDRRNIAGITNFDTFINDSTSFMIFIRISEKLSVYFLGVIKLFHLIRYKVSQKVCHGFHKKCLMDMKIVFHLCNHSKSLKPFFMGVTK